MKTKTPKETTVTTIDENVRVIDNPEEEEEQRKRAERKLRVRVADNKERFKLLVFKNCISEINRIRLSYKKVSYHFVNTPYISCKYS